MDPARLGRQLLALRHRRAWRQEDLATAARVPRSVCARIEAGRAGDVRVAEIDRVATALGARVDVTLWWHGERLDRLTDAVHAALVDEIVRRLRAFGWVVETEVTFEIRGERGSIDVLAWHPAARLLLVVEVKSAFGDLQATLMAMDR
jgi:transcriptional regulator with XRE-family HTH domain